MQPEGEGCPIPEGQECPTCQRRVPKKKKPSSPQTKVVSIRVPIDDVDTFEEILEAAAKHAGLYEKGHWKFWTVHRGLVLLLQEPGEPKPKSGLHRHHRKRRSQGGDDSPENIIEVFPEVHESIHRNPALAYEYGLLVHSYDDPAKIAVRLAEFIDAVGAGAY